MQLYGVYKSYADNTYHVGSVTVERITPKFYFLTGDRQALGFASRIEKETAEAHHTTPEQAIARHREQQRDRVEYCQEELAKALAQQSTTILPWKEAQP